MSLDWEQSFIAAYRRHLVIALPLTLLIIKLVVRMLARERKKDIFRSMLVLPLDFVYIAMGVLLAAEARHDSALLALYGSETNALMAVMVQMIALIFAATVVTVFDRMGRLLWGKFFAAWKLFFAERAKQSEAVAGAGNVASTQMSLELVGEGGGGMSKQSRLLMAWIMFYWIAMIPLQMGQMTLGVFCLGYTLDRLK